MRGSRLRLLFFLLILSSGSLAQVSVDELEPKVLFDNGVYLMESKNYSGARANFEEYLKTQDEQYQVEANYYNAICALKLYHLDGEKQIQDFIARFPSEPQAGMAYMEMGNYFFQDRNYKQAANYFSKVDQKLISKTNRAEVEYKLGYSYFATRKFTKALIEFDKVKSGNSKYRDPSHYYAGFIEYDQEKYEAALRDYKVIEKNKAFANSVPYMITSIYYKSGDYKKLVDYARPILDRNQRVQQAGQMAILLAESYYELEQFKDAVYYFNLAAKKEKFTAQSVYHHGIASDRAGNRDAAIKLLKSVAGQKNKVGALASYHLGKLYLESGNTDFAFTAFKSVMGNKAGKDLKEKASFTAGKLAYDLGRYSECISILTDFRKEFPNSEINESINEILAQAFLNTRNYKPALDYIESLEQKSENIWQAYQQATFHYGVGFYNDRKFSQAIEYFRKSLGHPMLNEYTLKANLWAAEAYSIGRRYEDALPFYNNAVALGEVTDEDGYWRAIYGRGYALYNTAKYNEALPDFKAYVEHANKKSITYGDALVRLADCYYVAKDYKTAISKFQLAIQSLVNEKDYAYYQAGVIYSILDNNVKALSYLDRVINVYTRSAYYDDALFEKGLIQLKLEEFNSALATFKMLRDKKPRSPYIAYALERSAVANFNLHNYNETVNLYKQFIDRFANNPGISDALIGLQESMNLNGTGDQFESYLADFRKNNPDITGLEKVELEAIKGYYNDQEYEKAAKGFEGYLSAYPNDFNTNEVKYLLAESLFRLNETDSALMIYKKLYHEGGESRIHRIIERIADIEFANQNYAESNKYYNELVQVAVSNNQKLRAWMGLMNGYYNLSIFDSTLIYIDRLLENGGGRNDFIVAATLKKGLTLHNLGRFEDALLNFEKTTLMAKDKYGAEAQYYIGLILHQQKDYTNSNEALYVIPEQFAMFTEWLDKGFMLVAENFIAMKEYFQAKATLQSIIDNSADEHTVQAATDRLEWVNAEETREINLVPDSLNTVEIDTSSNNEK